MVLANPKYVRMYVWFWPTLLSSNAGPWPNR